MATKKKAEGDAPKKKARSSSTRKTTASKARSTRSSTAKTTSGAKAADSVVVPDGRVVVEREIGGRTLTLETGRMAKLSDGAVVARYGDSVVLAAANSSKAPDFMDFFPLTVDYREKTSAAGIIPGGFFKREGRPSTKEILTCRIIDRSIRPMFPDGFRRDVQVLSQVLATDRENDPDVLAAIASFAAVAISSLPHGRSLGMVRIGHVDGKLVVNPLWSELQSENNRLNLTVAGHSDAIVMVEAGAKEVDEETMLEALQLAHDVVKQIVEMVEELVQKAGKPKMEFDAPEQDSKLEAKIDKQFGKLLRDAPLTLGPKQVRQAAIKAAKKEAAAGFPAPEGASEAEVQAWDKKIGGILGGIVKRGERESILSGVRADGRDTKTVRPITIEVGVLPRVHGSVLFTRGETQALGVVTLGGTEDQQIIDGLMPEPRKRFLLHYAFPPFSVGETKRMLAPGRREIGHGALAERGLETILPKKEDFPYTIRITSEILESNGSSSMATACAGTLAMMDAGVPIKQPVAGIAMGLVMEGKKYAVLSDILGSEDACGDMDFKIIGTGRGITALQMDIKCEGLTRQILAEALDQAKEGRLHILREMLKALRAPRQSLSPNAPRLESVQVPSDKIGLIIGPGGKNIRMLQETYECKISIEDSGLCTITGVNGAKVEAAVNYVKAMTAEIELGTVYEGRVTAIKEFGAFVEILPGQEGLVHVSELSNEFIRAVTDVVRIGDTVKVKVIAIDDFGKVKLSRKALLEGAPAAGSEPAAAVADELVDVPADFDERPRGRGDRRDRPERGERPDRPERPERPDRPERPERPERPTRMDRPDRPERPDRPDRDRPARGDRPDRPERVGRPERFDRPARVERDDEPRGGRGEPHDRPVREDRPAAREDHPARDDRPARPVRDDRPVRDVRPGRDERPVREDRDERPVREARDDRRPRRDRGDWRGEGDVPRGPRREFADRERVERDDRPARAPRPRDDEFVPRGPAPRGDEPRRPARGRREDLVGEPPVIDDRAPRGRGRPVRDDDRVERDFGAPRGRDFDDRDEDGPRGRRPRRGRGDDDRGGRGRGPDDRPRHPRADDDRPVRPARVEEDRPVRPVRDDEARPPRARDEERPHRHRADEEREPVRGGRERPGRAPMPMAEFDDAAEEGPAPGFGREPELESIDSVIGDDRGADAPRSGGRRGGRRPRRRD